MKVSRTTLVGVGLAIFAATAWLYWPSLHGEFLEADDLESYLKPAMRLHGLTWNAVKWAFTCTFSYYQPLARLSHVVDYQLWGTTAAGHHATSVVVHALNAALVLGFLWKLLGATSLTDGERLAVAVGVAVVFALHPLQVETVSWVSCRTELLCGTFGIGSLWAYAGGARWWAVWGLFAAAMLSTPLAVSLPFVMLAMDYFPLRRYEQIGWRRLLWEKTAMIGLVAAVGVTTMITMSQIHQMASLTVVSLPKRVYLMFGSLAFYLWKLAWPSHLSPAYPMPSRMSLDQGTVLASVLTVLMITVLAVRERRRVPMLTAAWSAYVVLVLPGSGLIPTGWSVFAHRYAYVAILPLLTLAGGAGVWLWRRSITVVRVVFIGLLAGQLCAFGVYTRQLIPDWRNDEMKRRAILKQFPDAEVVNREFAMWLLDHGRMDEALRYAQRDVELAPQAWEAHMTLGSVLAKLGHPQEAMAQHEQAFRLNDNPVQAHYNYGVALMALGKEPEAAEHFQQVLQFKPDTPVAHDNLGFALYQMNRVSEAIQEFEMELRLNPGDADAHNNLGIALAQTGRTREAIVHFEQALRLNPDYAKAHNNLGNALLREGEIKEAIAHFEEALRINPDFSEAHNNLVVALAQTGGIEEAIPHFEEVLRINPDLPEVHYNLGIALAQVGRVPQAMAHYEQALRIKPDYAEAQNNLAWLLATRPPTEGGDPVRAVALAEQACQLTGHQAATYLDTLAAAYASAGRFNDAIATAEKGVELARAGGQPELTGSIEARLVLYRSGHAYRQPVGETGPHNP